MTHMTFDDKAMTSDCLCSQKFLTQSYNNACTESAAEDLRREFLNCYQDEQRCLKMVFDAMSNKGWYQLYMASQQDVSRLQQQLSQSSQQVGFGIGFGQQGPSYSAGLPTVNYNMGQQMGGGYSYQSQGFGSSQGLGGSSFGMGLSGQSGSHSLGGSSFGMGMSGQGTTQSGGMGSSQGSQGGMGSTQSGTQGSQGGGMGSSPSTGGRTSR